MELYIIKLPKFNIYKEDIKNTKLGLWIKFIESPKEIDIKEENEEVVKTKKVLEKIKELK